MKSKLKKAMALVSSALAITLFASCSTPATNGGATTPAAGTQTEASGTSEPSTEKAGEPIKFTVTYSDNATLPFKDDWLAIQEIKKRLNVDVKFEIIPIADYLTKVSTMLNTNTAPDVVLYITGNQGEMPAISLNGGLVPISDYADWTPNFNNLVKEWNLQEAVDGLSLKDGKRYFMPSLYDTSFYDGGLIIREDLLQKYGLEAPKTYDDLYNVLKKFKEEDPTSYPLTILAAERVLYRFTMPSFGVSLGENSSSGTWVLSYDYDQKKYFAGATSEQYKEYLSFFSKLYKEGLLDPEFKPEGDAWATKLATGKAMASWAYYDQIGGVSANSEIEGFKLNLLPPLEGPAGAHTQPKNRTGSGIIFPSKTAKRADFEQIVKAVDEMFYSPEMAEMWSLGVEGITYTKNGDKIEYTDEIVNSKEGIYKYMQLKYGLGVAVTQLVWKLDRELSKYDENYGRINNIVAGMKDAIQPIPPTPKFDDLQAEEIGLLRASLSDTFNVWADAFITGKKSVETDWDAYVKEMNDKNIERYVQLCNDNL